MTEIVKPIPRPISASPEQLQLYDQFMRLSNGHTIGVIKIAAFNCLISVICKRSSSVDEARFQWNELSLAFDADIDRRHAADQLKPVQFKFNGG